MWAVAVTLGPMAGVVADIIITIIIIRAIISNSNIITSLTEVAACSSRILLANFSGLAKNVLLELPAPTLTDKRI